MWEAAPSRAEAHTVTAAKRPPPLTRAPASTSGFVGSFLSEPRAVIDRSRARRQPTPPPPPTGERPGRKVRTPPWPPERHGTELASLEAASQPGCRSRRFPTWAGTQKLPSRGDLISQECANRGNAHTPRFTPTHAILPHTNARRGRVRPASHPQTDDRASNYWHEAAAHPQRSAKLGCSLPTCKSVT
eukprot:GHVU01175762.1.p1 GENE.GHVU01175762.1~~GHVU01175762.1.p1  ORF type:complete len:188 (-),score=6.87 GHVU01175762.1:146-709(-)